LYQASSSGASEAAAAAATDDDDPEVQFLMSLTPKQKKRLLKYILHFIAPEFVAFCLFYCCILQI